MKHRRPRTQNLTVPRLRRAATTLVALAVLAMVSAFAPAKSRTLAADQALSKGSQQLIPAPARARLPRSLAAIPLAVKVWNFNIMGDREGWTVPSFYNGSSFGGALWLAIQDEDPTPELHQVYPIRTAEIVSPANLNIPTNGIQKIKLRILNLSPETDGTVRWSDGPDHYVGSRRFSMKPYCPTWQEIVCHIDGAWQATSIYDLRFTMMQLGRRGDIFIDWIALTDGTPRPALVRPDVNSAAVVPQITIPGIAQADFQEAFNVLNECLVVDVPMAGFTYPYLCPGGAYGWNWWQLDTSLNVAGTKWVNQPLSEGTLRGFIDVQAQNPDGRIDLWGSSPIRGGVGDVSSLPRYFEAAYDVARRTADAALREAIYSSMKGYLDWWLSSPKYNDTFGLVTGYFEEALGGPQPGPQMSAPVDLNMAVAVGCKNIIELAKALGKTADQQQYQAIFDQLTQNMNHYMWDETKGAHYSVDIQARRRYNDLICSTFDTLRGQVAPPERVARMLPLLLDPAQFNWGIRPVTSVAKTNPTYVEATGQYDGRAWYGDLWTMRNLPIIFGLEDIGRHDLAGELAWMTIKTFNGHYCEFVVPCTGASEGVPRYGWSASQYVQAIVEHLFGVDYDRLHNRLRIVPRVPAALEDQTITLDKLILPGNGDCRLKLTVAPAGNNIRHIALTITGDPGVQNLEVFLSLTAGMRTPRVTDTDHDSNLTVIKSADGLTGVAGVQLPLTGQLNLQFDYTASASTARWEQYSTLRPAKER